MFKLETGVPVPTIVRNRPERKYPFAEMTIGSSFFIEEASDLAKALQRIRGAAGRYAKDNGVRFTIRQVDGGIRIWRVA